MKRQWLVLLMLLPAWNLGFANDSPQALQDAFMTALLANDADGIAACYTADATNFPLDSMSGVGPESVRASWGGFFAAFRVTDVRLSDDQLIVLGDAAVAWGLFNITAEPAEGGEAVEFKGRYTDVAKNIDGTWLYVMDHASVPTP